MFSSNYCFLTCVQISQEAGQVVWYSHLFQNFPEFIVIHTVKGFGIANKAEIDVFLELFCGEGNGTPLQYSCLENPLDGGAWWAAVHGVAKSRTWLCDFTFTFHFHALEKEMTTHSSVLAWRIPGMGEPSGLPSVGMQRVRHDWIDLAAAAAGTLWLFRWSSGCWQFDLWFLCVFSNQLEHSYYSSPLCWWLTQNVQNIICMGKYWTLFS